MSCEEVRYRCKALVNRWHEEVRFMLGCSAGEGIRLSELRLMDTKLNQRWTGSVDHTSVAQRLCLEYPAYVAGIRAAADAICRRKFTLLGVPVEYASGISWVADPLSGKHWPMRFHSHIDIFAGAREIGDVKYVWELNRHQFLTILGKAYRLSGDDRYAAAAVELILDWIGANPYNVGINWTSALEVAIRSLSWCQTVDFIRDSMALGADKRHAILRSLWQHGHYIERHLSFFFSPYNHLVGEAAALYIVGSFLSWPKSVRRWKRKGWAVLEQEMSNQFHPDGGTVEQATGYHHFTLGFYIQAFLLRQGMGLDIPPEMSSLLEKAFEFSMYMTRPDGFTPMIGDADEGKALDLLQNSIWDFRPLLVIGAVLLRRGDFKTIAGPFPPDAAWLLGLEGWKKYESLQNTTPKDTSKVLSESGYCIMRTGWDRQSHYLNFDCGDIAAGVPKGEVASAAHGHADALSIEVSAYGVPILVDPGFYTYNGDEQWHRYFRETEAHNTVVVDGCSQAEYCGRLKWSHAPDVRLHHWMISSPFDYVEGSHDGYARLPQPVVHRRAVAFLKPDCWLVRDELSGEGQHQIDRFFHFGPIRVSVKPDAKIAVADCGGRRHLAILPLETQGLVVEAGNGRPHPASGWLASGYGKKAPAPVVRYSTAARVPIAFHTLIVPFREELPEIAVATPSVAGAWIQAEPITIQWIKHMDILLFFSGEKLVEIYKGWITDGRVAWLRLSEKGSLISCAVLDGAVVEDDSGFFLRVSHRVAFVILYFDNGQPVIEMSEPVELWTSLPDYRVIISKNQTVSTV